MTDKLSKYQDDELSDELLLYLRRNFPVSDHSMSFLKEPIKMITIDNKSYIMSGNKKYLVGKLYNLVSDIFDIDEKVSRRTIKKFIDGFS